MHIEFRDKKLRKCYESEKEAKRLLGTRAKRFISRINVLKSISNTSDLFRQYQYLDPHKYDDGSERISIKLTKNYRILFVELEIEEDKKYLEIEKVCDPHGNAV